MGIPITDYFIARCNDYSMPKLDYFEYIPGGNSYEEFRDNFFEVVKSLNPGIAEIIFHPSVESDKLKEITDSWQQRVWEAQLFADPEVINFLKEEEIIFTNWKELMKRYFISYVNKDDETCGGNTPCYSTIQAAIDAAETESSIRILQGTFAEDIIVNQAYYLTLSGGWDSSFTTQSSTTNINSLTIADNSGTVEIENIILQ